MSKIKKPKAVPQQPPEVSENIDKATRYFALRDAYQDLYKALLPEHIHAQSHRMPCPQFGHDIKTRAGFMALVEEAAVEMLGRSEVFAETLTNPTEHPRYERKQI